MEGKHLSGIVGGALVGISIVLSTIPALTFPSSRPSSASTRDVLGPFLLAEGWVTPTLGALVGVGAGPATLLPALAALLAAVVIALADVPRVSWRESPPAAPSQPVHGRAGLDD